MFQRELFTFRMSRVAVLCTLAQIAQKTKRAVEKLRKGIQLLKRTRAFAYAISSFCRSSLILQCQAWANFNALISGAAFVKVIKAAASIFVARTLPTAAKYTIMVQYIANPSIS